jgi:hypothetical protein
MHERPAAGQAAQLFGDIGLAGTLGTVSGLEPGDDLDTRPARCAV